MKANEFNPIGIEAQLDWQRIRKLLTIGLVASVIAAAGDMKLGWGTQDDSLTGIARMFSAYTTTSDRALFWIALVGMLCMALQGMSYFGIYRLMAERSPKYAHQYRSGIIGYLLFGPCGFHVGICAGMYMYRYLTQAQVHGIEKIMKGYASSFVLPAFILFWLFVIVLEVAHIQAFMKNKTPYPKWCAIFSLPVGLLLPKCVGLFGNYPIVNAIDCAWVHYANIWVFGGLLLTMKYAKKSDKKSETWTITHIFDGDYGCEEQTTDKKQSVSVTLKNEAGEEKIVSVTDEWLTENRLDIGSVWPEAENIGEKA